MKKYRIFLISVIVITLMILPTVVLAEGLTVSYEDTEYGVGDVIELSVTVSGENLSVSEGNFTYDYNVLTYIESYGGASDGSFNMVSSDEGGASSLTAVLKFEAIAAGECVVDIKFDNILNYDGANLVALDDSIRIEVLSDDIIEDSQDEGDEANYTTDFDGVEAKLVYNNDRKMFVSRSVENLTLPSGFVDYKASYDGEEIGAAISARDDKTVVFYLYDNSGQGGYYIFDEASNALSPYVKIATESDDYIILWNNGDLDVPDGYNETSIEVNGKIVCAFITDDAKKPSHIVYAISDAGKKGYYEYLVQDNTIAQYLGDMKEPVKPTVADVEKVDEVFVANDKMFLAVCAVCFVLFIALIVFIAKYFTVKKDQEELLAVSRKKIQEYRKMLNR